MPTCVRSETPTASATPGADALRAARAKQSDLPASKGIDREIALQEEGQRHIGSGGVFASVRGRDGERERIQGVGSPRWESGEDVRGDSPSLQTHTQSVAERELEALLKSPLKGSWREDGGVGCADRMAGGWGRGVSFAAEVGECVGSGTSGTQAAMRGVVVPGKEVSRGEGGHRGKIDKGRVSSAALGRDGEGGEGEGGGDGGGLEKDGVDDGGSTAGLRRRILAAARLLHRDSTPGTATSQDETDGAHARHRIEGGIQRAEDEQAELEGGGRGGGGGGRVTAEERARDRLSRHRERARELEERERELKTASASASADSARSRPDVRHIGLL